eukprot:TRINITY_DN37596_c0_g1_i1.p1 TRINITY_DN37596_c0_g1~~TRINITY_DN37596_c0_g1_i1.p1  ORF type:complete len:126 (+),score=16.49 TRINITY_DN37596_c0_g1_i1:35-379(+)
MYVQIAMMVLFATAVSSHGNETPTDREGDLPPLPSEPTTVSSPDDHVAAIGVSLTSQGTWAARLPFVAGALAIVVLAVAMIVMKTYHDKSPGESIASILEGFMRGMPQWMCWIP